MTVLTAKPVKHLPAVDALLTSVGSSREDLLQVIILAFDMA